MLLVEVTTTVEFPYTSGNVVQPGIRSFGVNAELRNAARSAGSSGATQSMPSGI